MGLGGSDSLGEYGMKAGEYARWMEELDQDASGDVFR